MNWNRIIFLFSLVVVISIGMMHLHYPFRGDQAFFMVFAKMLSQGYIQYLDIWDFKQPGIFFFFYAGGKLFGFTEFGVHLFELLYWLGFGIYGVWILKQLNYFKHSFLHWAFPILFIGIYYLSNTDFKLTQVEGLVGFPLFFGMTFPFYSLKQSKYTFAFQLLTGLSYGIVLFFKIAFIPILGIFTLYFSYLLLIKYRTSWSSILLYHWFPIIIGSLLLPAIYVGYCIQQDILPLVVDTFFVQPFTTINNKMQKPFSAFLQSTISASIQFSPLLVLSFGYLVANFRKLSESAVVFILWGVVGLWIIYIQKFSYWGYQYFLLLPPLIILSMLGIDNLLRWNKFQRFNVIPIVIVVLLFSPYYYKMIKKTKVYFDHHFTLTFNDQLEYKAFYNPNYPIIKEEVSFLANTSPDVTIYVCGDPLYYYLSNKPQGASIIGWSLELISDDIWDKLIQEINTKKVTFIFVTQPILESLSQVPNFKTILDQFYRIDRINSSGTWFKILEN